MPLTHDEFVRRLVAAQGALRGYVLTLVLDVDRAEDVLQDVSVALWRKLETYQPERPFLNWALGVARNEILHARRETARSRLVFNESLLEKAAERYEALQPELQRRRAALQHCVEKMPVHYREVVRERYLEAQSVGEVARRLGRSVGAVHMLLSRIRQVLAECASRQLLSSAPEGRP